MRRTIDIAGRTFGDLTVEGLDRVGEDGHAYWLCRCACGATASVRGSAMRLGRATHCGHRTAQLRDRTGEAHDRLTVLGLSHRGPEGHPYWRCRCACGNETTVRGNNLGGHVRSCGCLRAEHQRRRSRAIYWANQRAAR